MKQIMRMLSMAAIVIAGAFTMGCNKAEVLPQQEPEVDTTVTLTATINLDEKADTRALAVDGNNLRKTFSVGDQVAVVYTIGGNPVVNYSNAIQAADILSSGKAAKITVPLSYTPDPNSPFQLVYPASMVNDTEGTINYDLLNVQDGTLATIARELDLCTYEGSFTAESELPKPMTLTNRLAICKFTILAYGTQTQDLTRLNIHEGTHTYSVKPSKQEAIWVAMHPFNGQILNFKAASADKAFEKNTSMQTLKAGKFYTIILDLNSGSVVDFKSIPLTVEAKTAGAEVTFTGGSGVSIEYSTDGTNWTTYSAPITLANATDKVMFRGTNSSFSNCHLSMDEDCYVYGNIMSLLDAESFSGKQHLGVAQRFMAFFSGQNHLLSHPDYPIVLPATNLTNDAYHSMFQGCTGLTLAPVLPATVMKNSCYRDMFSGSGLVSVPDLPASTLAQSCFQGMFSGCMNLTSAPASLPVESLQPSCYADMFMGCEKLTSAPALPATTLATSCYERMFAGCSSLTASPVLPAPDLVKWCYRQMFQWCSSLKTVTCLAIGAADSDVVDLWLDNVAEGGTFYKSSSMVWTGAVPASWTIVDYVAP